MDKLKSFIKRYKIIFSIFVFFIASFVIYAFVHANDDIYENQIEVSNQSLNIIDGTPNLNGNFDANDDAGNDSANNNKIVRTFDTVTYEVSYKLKYKDDSSLSPEDKILDNTRDVIIDILVPENLTLEVSTDSMNVLNALSITDNNGNHYKYYKAQINSVNMSENDSVDVIFSKIIGKNNDEIKPIIRLREKTQAVTEIVDSINVQDIQGLDVPTVRISAKESYGVHLYQGTIKKDDENINSRLPVGILVYLPYDSNKEFKGIQIPEGFEFDLNINCNVDSDKSTIVNANIGNYSQDTGYVVSELPYSLTNNGNASVTENYVNQNKNSSFKINFADLKFDNLAQTTIAGNNVYYISSKMFLFTNKRESTYKSDITYDLSSTAPNSNTISDYLDNYSNIVGDYTSTIDFFNRPTSSEETVPIVESGKAIYNFNEEFYIQNTINYGLNRGDKLTQPLTNYIKIDTDAFILEDVGNVSDQTLDYYIQFGNDSSQNLNYEAKYVLGEWNSNYFEVANNRPSYCPNSLTNIPKEQIMNMYGGPCIKEKNTVTTVNSIAEAQALGKLNKIIAFKLTINDEYPTGLQTIIRLKAKASVNTNNIGKTYQFLTRGKTTYNNKDYYLSEIPKISVSDQSADLTYNKSVYDNNYNLTNLHSSNIGSTQLNKNVGNTVLISSFKTYINDIVTKDVYNSEKTTFYSGMTDPIEFIINPVIYKSDYDSTITSATISVYLPEQLEIYEAQTDKKYNRDTSGNVETIDGVNYKVYNYDYSEHEINFDSHSASGTIPNLYVHAYISLATPDRSNVNVLTRINGTLKTATLPPQTYTSTMPLNQRTTTVNLTLRNIRDINTIGKTNLLYIDRDGTYEYNMRIANASQNEADMYLMYVLPYSGDSIGGGSKFTGTISVSFAENLPEGYTAYYTTDNAKTVLTNELNSSVNWRQWINPKNTPTNATAVKVVAQNKTASGNYFGTVNGLTLKLKTANNKIAEKYFNNFYVIQKDADICVSDDIIDDCSSTRKGIATYSSNISEVSVYNRTISGYAFEDVNYNGFYERNEPRLKDIAVDLYRLNATEFDPNNPVDAISDQDQLVQEGTTDQNGAYKFEGLRVGNYYVKYTFDCEKYTVTEKNKVDPASQGDTSAKDSDAQMLPEIKGNKVCYAVSNIQWINNNYINRSNIDLGLRVRQDFDININKYITNVMVNSNKGTQSYNYNNQTKVKIDVKNLKNTTFRVKYGIEIENTKYFPGTIGSIVETIPKGMTFNPNLPENEGWYESGGYLYYSGLTKSLIMPGEKYHMTIVLDLATSSGGDYINIVAANNLQIKPVITNFLEVPEAIIVDQGGE